MPFEQGDVVRAPFPFVEEARLVMRPALVVSRAKLGPEGLVIWVAMITNAARQPWPGDIVIPDHETVGLPIPSRIRTEKIAIIQAEALRPLGQVDKQVSDEVISRLRSYLT